MPEAARPQAWRRLALAHALQIPAVVAVILTPAAWLPAALWASAVCCFLTDSGWRWRNRLLVAEAVAWLSVALSTIPF